MMAAMQTIHLYGIPNCDTVKKARDWLTAQGQYYAFHDFKKEGVPMDLLPAWLKAVGRDTLINRKGPTWRKLGPEVQASVVDDATAVAVMEANSSVIKRPVVVWLDGSVTVGFTPALFQAQSAR
jgi:Spx/MgsR family transcriptional regulator